MRKTKSFKTSATSAKKNTYKPPWNDNITDISKYQLSNTEQLQKKVSYSSKNRLGAKESVERMQEQLKQGKIPAAYKDAIAHKMKKGLEKEEYRERAKAIIYPKICTRSGSNFKYKSVAAQAEMKKEEPKVQEIEQEIEAEPVKLSTKTVDMAFTSSKNLNSYTPIEMIKDFEIPPPKPNEECEDNYLDCKVNLSKLEKLQYQIDDKPKQIEDYMAALNSALSVTALETQLNYSEEAQNEEISEPENEGDNEYDIERIRQLICDTQKDIVEFGLSSQTESEADPTPSVLSVLPDRYENSFSHLRGRKKVAQTTEKENFQPSNTGIISRKISNKMGVNLISSTNPVRLTVESDFPQF